MRNRGKAGADFASCLNPGVKFVSQPTRLRPARVHRPLAGCLSVVLSGCTPPPPEPPPTVPPPPPCPVVASSNWRASIDAMPGPDSVPTLVVVGSVRLAGAGWAWTWGGLSRSKSAGGEVWVALDFVATNGRQPPPQQVVHGSWQAPRGLRAVEVRCRGTTVARMARIEHNL